MGSRDEDPVLDEGLLLGRDGVAANPMAMQEYRPADIAVIAAVQRDDSDGKEDCRDIGSPRMNLTWTQTSDSTDCDDMVLTGPTARA